MNKPPKRFDLFYNYIGGKLEIVTFLEEGLSDPSCQTTTYLMQGKSGKFRCSKDMYCPTALQAYLECLDECKEAVPLMLETIKDAVEHLEQNLIEIKNLEALILSETAKPAKL